MTLETLSKGNLNFYAPRFEVEIEGEKLDVSTSKEIIDVTVYEKLDEGASFELTFHNEFDMNTQKFKWIDDSRFNVGNKITIKIGSGSNLHTMLMGRITSLEPSFFAGDTPTLKIRGQDPSYDYMKRATPERTFIEKTYSDIVRTIAQEAGLDCVVDNTGKFEKFIRKNNSETYYEFLDDIRNKVGFVFYIEGRTIHFVKSGNNKKEILKLELGKDIISFNPVMNTTGLLAEVEVRGHNPQDPNTIFIGKAKAERELVALANKTGSKDLAKKVITVEVVNSKEHAVAIAKAELAKANDTLFGGKVECIGLPQIRVGVNVKLEKIGKLFSHKYYVTETTHTINERGYVTRFSVGHNNSILDELGTTNKSAGKLNGVACGIVTNNKDPDKLGRLKVKFPWLSDDNETDWVRMTTFMAGGGRGSFFLPEVGDEVLVAFENGNINRPYIIGALWNGVDKPIETNSDGKNNIRKIKSRSGHELIFNDEENKENVEIHTKAGHTIVLDDSSGKEKLEIKDKSGNNSILIDSANNAMAISSQMKIEIKSGSNSITIDSVANSIAISSQLKLSLKAPTIEIEAGGMMTIKSSGILTLQGSLVKIN
ncbi:phage baseplate assembly protein V [Methanosarcina sp. WWM596]|uniref:phage baseplate assembly protein V n=1 Tax=Methanosarcina sp. WWM596 TaxID=1434103 RepID=UPI000615D92D|nr:phage baseplate assembly protein V [Methanosarcina sp. WWM596]AKB18668.1 VgrG protein [Methanosarcina sp. WWM596]